MQSLRLYFDCISACNWSFFKSHFSPALWGQNSVFSQSKRIHSDIVFSFQLLWKASSQRHMPFPNHHSRPIFRLQAAFLAFSLRSKSKFPDTARSIPAYLGGQSVENLAGSGRSRMFSDEGNPNAHGRRAIRFPRLQRPLWKHPEMAVFFAQLPIHTKPHAEINEIHFRKSGFRLLLRPICFCFLPSFERTNRQWVIRARINAPPAKHAGMSKLIARICHLSPFRIISSWIKRHQRSP